MPEPLLEVTALDAFYGDFQALFGVSLKVAPGEVVAVIGANGAGKSTLLKCIAGAIRSRRDAILFDGAPIGAEPAHAVVGRGIALVPEGRRLFPSLSVEENLRIGGQLGHPGPWSLARIYELFPVLAERRHQPSTSLSGGQQQMVAIGRALMAMPRLLLLDEPSLGLAPQIVDQVFEVVAAIHAEGVAVLLVEQNIVQAFAIAARAYVLEQGRIVAEGAPSDLARDARIREAYLGQQ
jgi:branched-chain amino acid transport system ATP-binding protein